MILVPVTHDLIHLATVHTARLPLGLLDEVAEERGAWRKRHMIDVAVQGLVHSEHELSHTTACPHAGHPRGSGIASWNTPTPSNSRTSYCSPGNTATATRPLPPYGYAPDIEKATRGFPIGTRCR